MFITCIKYYQLELNRNKFCLNFHDLIRVFFFCYILSILFPFYFNGVIILVINIFCSFPFQGFVEYAEMVIENGTTSLIHSQHKFIRDRIDNDRSYWRCRHSFKYNCKARVVTKLVNGYEMLKVRNAEHNHTDIKKPTKSKKKAMKLKQKKTKPKSNFIARIMRPQLATTCSTTVPQLSTINIPQMPKLKPKPIPKVIPSDGNDSPNYDAENALVNILD